MERATVAIYDERGLAWAATHSSAGRRADAESFAAGVPPGALRIDVGCGAGRYLPFLGSPTIALDASASMLAACRRAVPHALFVQGDAEQLPLTRGSIGGAWSWMTHLHVPRARLPLALWDLQRALVVGAPLGLQVLHGDYEGDRLPGDEVGGRFFAGWRTDDLVDVVVGAGFGIEDGSVEA
ncbi:MAG: class I SAM-dependent methyltransferase, partial [Acidimicrobiales bacterium]